MSGSALGAALEIPKSALDKIKEADDKLVKLQQTAKDTASSVKTSFAAMEGGAKGFIGALDQIITKLGTIDTKSKSMSGSLNNLGATKAAQDVTQMNGAITKAAENIERMSASQKKMTNSADFSKSISDWQNLQAQIDTTSKRQQELTNFMRQYEMEQQRIRSGKGGVISRDDQANYASAQKEFEANKNIISSLREKQQQIVNNNQALNRQIELIKSLRTYGQDYSFSDKRYKAEMQQLKEAIQLRAKKAAESQKQSNKEQAASDKEAKAIEKAEERKRAAWAKSTAAYGQQYHNERQAMYNQLFSTRNTTVPTAVANSQSATTLRDHIAAIKELQQARLNLVTTDKNYKQNLATINEAIKQHSKVLKDAGLNARNLGEQYSYIQGYLSRLAQRTAVVFSMSAAKGFVENIAEVRGQMEMSQRSLESILQNKPKADEIFNKTVELAVKSPFRIKDLVDYTRQLSAYRIESDKLYDTTKRLADVSAGLGVDMGRLILAYGQVKAAAYLRGSEVRQFTEAGVNMYGELQQYFKEVKGEAYTTAQIVDMISKRMVKFEDVEAIFQRMTDKGGMFYNMQETQANTLYGMIQKFHDAFDVMLNDIGKSSEKDLKNAVSTATELLKHWEQIANAAKATIGIVALMALYMKQMGTQKISSLFTSVIATDATKTITTVNLLKNSLANASKFVTMFGANLKAAFMANLPMIGIMAAVSAVYSLVNAFVDLREAQVELGKKYYINSGELNKIAEAYDNIGKSAKKSTKDQKDSDTAQDIQDKRKQIEELVKIAGSNGLSFDVNINVIKPENLDKTFEDLKSQYKEFINQMAVIENNRATNKSWKDHWFVPVDDFEKDAKQYSAAAANMMAHASDIDDAVAAVSGHMEEATDKTRKYYEEVKKGKKDGESELDYYERMYDLLSKIGKLDGSVLFGSGSAKIAARLRQSTLFNLAGDLKAQREELNGELDDLFKNTSDRLARLYGKGSKKYRMLMSAEIDSQSLDRQVADLAKKRYNAVEIPTKANKEGAEREIKTIIQDLQDYARKNKINLSVEVDDPKNLIGTIQGYQKSAKDWQETIESMERSSKRFFTGAYLDIGKSKQVGKERWDSQTVIPKQRALQYAKEQLKAALYWNKGLGGLDPFAKSGGNTNTNTDKSVTDILQERVNLLKEMNDKYEELQDHMSDKSALSSVRQYFADSAKNVGWNANDILPDAHSVIERLKELAKQASTVSKRGQILRIAADIQAKWDKKYNEQQLDEAKKDVEDAFSKLDLFKKLREEGLNKEQINAMFGDLTTSFEDARKRITDTFEAKYGKDHTSEKWGDKETKEYEDAIKKLDEKVAQDQVAQAQELIKAYKTQLTEQLQLDKWYYGERIKIRENANLNKDPELQKQLEDNLTSQFKKKQADIDWKNFQNSDTYIAIFENLEHTSTKALDYMIEKLRGVREQLKGLDPTQVKAITEQIEKLEQTKNAKNPFKAFTSGYKEMIKASKEFKKLGGINAWVSNNKLNDAEKADIQDQEALVASLEAEYNQLSENKELESDKAKQLKVSLDVQKAILNQKKADNKATQEGVDKLNNAKGASEKAKNKFSTSVTDITSMISAMGQAFGSLGQNLGIADDYFSNSVNLIDHAGQAVGSFYSKNWAGVVSNAVGAVGDIINLFSSESKIDKEIERQERAVTRLQNAYSDLKQSMDDAFDIENLQKYHNKSVETLEDEKKAYEAMINAERGRKNPDDGKIEQWQQEIQSLDKTIKELGESLTESLGGFGSEANYKSAAQAFADAWVDAFNEGSDALDALNDKFDDYFNDMLKKQLMQRATSKFIEPILKAFDDAVAEGSEGGNNGYELTKDEIAHIKDLKETNLKAFDEYARNLMDVLGVKPSGSSNLSNLQQGIQAVTETTAQALESILNSMRLYVSQQQSDVAAIRTILEQRLGAVAAQAVEGGASNQMLALMEQQAGYLKQICDNWSSVLKSGHKQGGKGLKVFMN